MRADDLVVGEAYAYRKSWPQRVTYVGHLERETFASGRLWSTDLVCRAVHVGRLENGTETQDTTAASYLMPWAEWEAQQAKAGEAARERREADEKAALCAIRTLSPDLWHTIDTLTPHGMSDLAAALKTLARCLREEARNGE